MNLLILYVGLAISVSFLCSLLEAALLSSRNAALVEQKELGNSGAALLLEIRTERVDDAISAILTLNTIANTLGATLAGAQAAKVFGSTWVGIFSGVLAFMILVFSEIIPKTLGTVYWRQAAGFVGWSLHLLTRAMTPALVVSRLLTRIFTRGRVFSFSRGELATMITVATRHGVLSPAESKIFDNLLRFDKVRVEDVMTPRTVAVMLPTDATVADLIGSHEAEAFSRIPLYRENQDDVAGYVLQREALRTAALGKRTDVPLETLLRPIPHIPEMASVGAALRQILDRREHIAMTIDEHGGISGLVTLEDLTETILGVEIIDESDRIVDQRQAAAQLRDERMKLRLQQRRDSEDGKGSQPNH